MYIAKCTPFSISPLNIFYKSDNLSSWRDDQSSHSWNNIHLTSLLGYVDIHQGHVSVRISRLYKPSSMALNIVIFSRLIN